MSKKSDSKEIKTIKPREILVGNKPLMKYVIASIMQLKQDGSALIKARGKFISKAVDIAEVTRKRINEKEEFVKQNDIKIGTEDFTNDKGEKINVSSIEITLSK
ncbi:MAG: RNA-binding protein [Candidatus Pacearchaeota archaeon]|jgi:DNA-binding protein